MLDRLIEYLGMMFWKSPKIGPNTVLVIEGRKPLPYEKSEHPHEQCGLHRYKLKDRLVFRQGISGVNHRVYRATDPLTGDVIQVPYNVFHALFSPTKVAASDTHVPTETHL